MRIAKIAVALLLLFPLPSSAGTTLLSAATAALHASDATLTVVAISSGVGREANPVLAGLSLPAIVASKVGIAVVQSLAIRALDRAGHPKLARVAGIAAIATAGFATSSGIRAIARRR